MFLPLFQCEIKSNFKCTFCKMDYPKSARFNTKKKQFLNTKSNFHKLNT